MICITQVHTPRQYSYLHNCVAFYAKQIQRELFGAAEAGARPEYENEPNIGDSENECVMIQKK